MYNILLIFGVIYYFSTASFASSYEEKTVYTQAVLNCVYKTQGDTENHKYLNSGKYGNESPKEEKAGHLYYERNQSWCSYFGKMETNPNPLWIALIPRDEKCDFKDKIEVALKYNASAVIFYNNEQSTPEFSDGRGDIVSMIIAKESGQDLIKLFTSKKSINAPSCKITVGTHYVDRRWKVSRTSVLFVLVSFILLMCISLAWLVFYYVQRFRHIYQNDRKEKQLLNAAKKVISKLKMVPFISAANEEDESCAVCLESYKEAETLRELPCKHQFHKGCIDPWLLYHRTCPMCKSNILKSLGVDVPVNITFSSSAPIEIHTRQSDTNPPSQPLTVVQDWSNRETNASTSSDFSDSESDGSSLAFVRGSSHV